MVMLRDMVLCEHCIDALRSRGVKMMVNPDEFNYDWEEFAGIADYELPKCEWCEADEVELHEVIFL